MLEFELSSKVKSGASAPAESPLPDQQRVSNWRLTRRNFAAASILIAAGTYSHAAEAFFGRHRGRGKKRWCPPRPDGGGGTRCFLAGTRVQTPTGDVPVEQLKAGDLVVARCGGAKPVVSVVSYPVVRRIDGDWQFSRLPVRIRRGALAPAVPISDLYVSMNHMLLIDGVLIPAGFLVNGRTITIDHMVDAEQFEYFHIELAEHDVVLAEGAPCETFVQVYDSLLAPVVWNGGLRGQVASRLRSAISPIVDVRNRADKVRDRLDERAELLPAA